jgi:hypothetical protein
MAAGIVCALCFSSAALKAQDNEKNGQNEAVFTLPMEVDFDGGADNGDATFLKLQPLFQVPLTEEWSLLSLNILMLADAPGGIPGSPGNPSPSPGAKTFGLGDFTTSFLLAPNRSGRFLWAAGFMATLPFATDSTLGSKMWSAGPAVRAVYREGPWNLAIFGGNQWSYAGESDRSDINQLMLRASIRRNLANNWYLVSAPVITANWKANKSSDTWMLPLGGGIGKVLGSDSLNWALSMQAYANVIKPDGAPDWVIRFGVAAPLSLSFFGL